MIDTNGFHSKLIASIVKEKELDHNKSEIDDYLSGYYEELSKLKEKYNFTEYSRKGVDLDHKKRQQQSISDYYRFRTMVDGLYNLFNKYGFQYYTSVINYLRVGHAVHVYNMDNFGMIYQDDVTDTTPEGGYTHRICLAHGLTGIRYSSSNYEFSVEFPVVLNLDEVLTDTEEFIIGLVEADEEANKDKEYQEYLRLKEKFGDK